MWESIIYTEQSQSLLRFFASIHTGVTFAQLATSGESEDSQGLGQTRTQLTRSMYESLQLCLPTVGVPMQT